MFVLWMNSLSKDNIHLRYPCHANVGKFSQGDDALDQRGHVITKWLGEHENDDLS